MFAMVAADSASKSVQVLEKLTKFIVSVLMCVQTKQVRSAPYIRLLSRFYAVCAQIKEAVNMLSIVSQTPSQHIRIPDTVHDLHQAIMVNHNRAVEHNSLD